MTGRGPYSGSTTTTRPSRRSRTSSGTSGRSCSTRRTGIRSRRAGSERRSSRGWLASAVVPPVDLGRAPMAAARMGPSGGLGPGQAETSRPSPEPVVAIAPGSPQPSSAEYVHNAGDPRPTALRGHTRHDGDARDIIRACIEACWNGRTFTASPGHFDMFWTRDLSFSVPSLVRPGLRRSGARLARARARTSGPAGAATSRPPSTTSTGRATSTSTASTRCRCSSPRSGPPARTTWSSATGTGSRRRSPTSTGPGRRPSDRARPVRPQVQRPPGHRGQPIQRLWQHDGRAARQDDRGDRLVRLALRAPLRGRVRPAAPASTSGTATTSATRSGTTRSRVRPTSGRSTRA